MNPVIELLQNRVSCPKLMSPGPNPEQLEQILQCAMRAPDHARLRPWRYYIVQGDALNKLGDVFADAASQDEAVPQDKIEKCRNMPLRSPLMIVAVCEPTVNPKVPHTEQVLAVGAGIQNMQVAISSLGLASVWRTGDMAHHPLVKQAFNVSEQGEIVGFIYVGTPQKLPAKPELDVADYVQDWN